MDKKTINVSILQMASIIGNVDANINKVKNIIDSELNSTSDILVLPEVWSCGWDCKIFQNTAQSIENSDIINFLKDIAREKNVNIIGGSFISIQNGVYYNTCPVIDKYGNLIAIYNKNHLFSYYGSDEGTYVNVGSNPVLIELEGVKFGLTICYDIRFPEIYRAYRKVGADVLVNCAAWGASKPIPWEMMTKSRAIENQCFMIAVNQCGKINESEYNLGYSRIIDYKGEELALIKENEGIVSATLSFSEMYDFREKCTILNDIKNNYEVKILCVR